MQHERTILIVRSPKDSSTKVKKVNIKSDIVLFAQTKYKLKL